MLQIHQQKQNQNRFDIFIALHRASIKSTNSHIAHFIGIKSTANVTK